MVISGDMNLSKISWDSLENTKGSREVSFLDILNDYFLTQMNFIPTRGDKMLDLVITSVPDHVRVCEVLSPQDSGVFTDHGVVCFEFRASTKAQHKVNRTVYDYGRGDFEGLRRALESINLCNLVRDSENIDLDWTEWKDVFMSAVSDYIPARKIKGRNTPPWISGEIIHILRKKETARLKLRKPTASEQQRQKYKELRKKAKIMIQESRENYFGSLDSDLARRPKRFWSIFKLTSKSRSFPESMSSCEQNELSTQASTPRRIAELFNSYFASVFSAPSEVRSHPVWSSPSVGPFITDLQISVTEVRAHLRQLDVNKAAGSDGIPSRLLKETAEQIAPSLTKLFNKSLQLGVVPSDWKLANLVPVFKKGKREHVDNYRPISLLSVISKILERCVLAGLKDHLQQKISLFQHGFLAGRSCITQLTSVLDYIGAQLDSERQTDVIYLDMSKAFDKVDHAKLLDRLFQFGIAGSLHDWFKSYLRDRKQRVTVLGATSEQLLVTSGVPQGSLLGPMLFLLFVNDLPDTVTSPSRVACYADDTKVLRTINSASDCAALQSDLNSLVDWTESSGLLFNKKKCKCQRITRKKNPQVFQYSISGAVLETCESEKDLGVWVSSDLSWDKQIFEQCTKANKLLGFVRRASKNIFNMQTRRTLFLTIVRCHLGYASQVWSPQSIGLLKQVEGIQQRATKYILKLPFRCDIPYKTRLQMTNLIPLSFWHEYLDIVFFYKVVNNLIYVNSDALPVARQPVRVTRSSSSNTISYIAKKCRTVTYQRSFFIRCTRTWNVLPEDIKNNQTLPAFKKSLFQYYFNALAIYDQDDTRTWRTICPKCNVARNLTRLPSCCF